MDNVISMPGVLSAYLVPRASKLVGGVNGTIAIAAGWRALIRQGSRSFVNYDR